MKIFTRFVALFALFSILTGVFSNPSKAATYTIAEVAKHNTNADCWMVFDGTVYNLTSYIPNHDQYLNIRSWCGNDITADFTSKAGEGIDHSARAYSMLAEFEIGTIGSSTPDPTTPAIVPAEPTPTPVVESSPEVTSKPVVSENNEEEFDHFSVEISGQTLKELSVQAIANLWEIDSTELLNALISKYSLEGSYTIESTINDLWEENNFSPSEVKGIAEQIMNDSQGTQDSATTQDATTAKAKNPYNFFLPFLLTVVLYTTWFQLLKTNLRTKSKIFTRPIFNIFWNSILLLGLIPAFGFGIFMIARYSFPPLWNIKLDIIYWHVELSVVFATVALMHLINRLTAYLAPLKLFRRR